MSEFTIAAIPSKSIEMVWPIASTFIENAIEYSNNELDILVMKQALLDRELILITVNDNHKMIAAFTVKKEVFQSGKKVLTLVAIGGARMKEWLHKVDEVLCAVCREEDCSEMYLIGRPGWIKLLEPLGFETIHTVVSKKIA